MTPARAAALRVLSAVRRGGWSDGALKEELRRSGLCSRDAALCTRLVYGVQQNESLLDFYLAGHSTRPLGRLENRVLDILRLGAYQIVFLDKIPDYAGVSACVDMAREASGSGAAGYVNAVLRALARAPALPAPDGDFVRRMSVLYSHPAWLVENYLDRLDEAECEALLRANNGIPPLWIQANRLKCDGDALREALAADGAEALPHPFLPGCLALSHSGDPEALEAYRKGLFLIADPASRLGVMAAAPKPGDFVIDGCAAPGGKSFLAAVEMENTGRILSCDIHAHKMNLIKKGGARLGLSIVEPCLKDAAVFDPTLEKQADIVIADLPCSGLGVIAKKPDVRRKRPEDIQNLPAVQRRLLANLCRYVKPGGRLLYITCTLNRVENEDVATAFLEARPDFDSEPFTLPAPVGHISEGQVTLWPHRQETDGFFIALFRRAHV